MNWYILAGLLYSLLVIIVCLRILYDTRSTSKAFAYLLIAILIPVVGMVIYFAVGANYRKNKLYSKKIINDNKLLAEVREVFRRRAAPDSVPGAAVNDVCG